MADVESKLSDLQLQVYNVIRTAGWEGATTDEIEVVVKRTHQSVSARVNELAAMKLIEARAARRKTRAGKPAAIYILYGLRRANPDRDQADVATK
jgi:predicted transcriptional regulator